MKFSTKCRYGARAILEIAKNYEKGPVKRKDIVKNQQISDSYLENILISLRNNGIIDTLRGAKGGYMLRRPPEEITFLEVVLALEGSLAPVDCLDNPALCDKIAQCPTRDIWRKIHVAKEKVLKNVTLKELVENRKESYIPNYSI
jgi:Rrf2 family protein